MGWDLGAALNVQGLANILPQRPNVLGALVPAAEVLARDPKLPLLDPDRIKVGWRIFVENASRIRMFARMREQRWSGMGIAAGHHDRFRQVFKRRIGPRFRRERRAE